MEHVLRAACAIASVNSAVVIGSQAIGASSGREQAATYRKKDLEFAAALIAAGLVEARTLHEQVNLLPVRDGDRKRLHYRVAAAAVEG